MSGIKTLADELRQRIREHDTSFQDNGTVATSDAKIEEQTQNLPAQRASKSVESLADKATTKRNGNHDRTQHLLEQIRAFPNKGSEKLLIRLDGREIQLLKQLKLVSGIDMIQVIAFSLDQFLKSQPDLKEYIKRSLLNELK